MSAVKAVGVLIVLAIAVFLFLVLVRNMKAGSTTAGSGGNLLQRVVNSLQFGVTGSSNSGVTGSGTGSSNISKPPTTISNDIAGTSGSATKTVTVQPKLNVSGSSGSSNLGASGSGTGNVTLKEKSIFCRATGLFC